VGFPNSRYKNCLPDTVASSPEKSVVATGTDFQYMATKPNREFTSMTVHEYILHPDSLAKNAAAFFSISFSIRSLRFSSRRRFNSSNSPN
jgi:hypothetical protein